MRKTNPLVLARGCMSWNTSPPVSRAGGAHFKGVAGNYRQLTMGHLDAGPVLKSFREGLDDGL